MSISTARWLVAALAAGAIASHADAVVLDWNTETWTPTTPSPNTLQDTYDVDGTPGTDITLSLTYATQSSGSPYRAGLPAVDATLQGGQGAGVNSLHLGVDFTAQSHTITITVDFSNYAQGVEGVSFSLFDIDRDNGTALYIDQIRSITGTAPNGSAVAPVITGVGSTVTESGTGLSQVLTGNGPAADTGAGSNAGNATITFASPIRSFTFVWGVPNNNANNPIPMDISMGDINFSPVPEVNPAFGAAFVCLVGFLGARRFRSRA